MYPGGNPNFDEMRDPSLPGGPAPGTPIAYDRVLTQDEIFIDQNRDGIDDRVQQLQQHPDGTWSSNFIGVGNKQWNLPGNQNPYQTPGQPQIDPRMFEILMGQLPGGQW